MKSTWPIGGKREKAIARLRLRPKISAIARMGKDETRSENCDFLKENGRTVGFFPPPDRDTATTRPFPGRLDTDFERARLLSEECRGGIIREEN
jgi:hypothetical protein